MEVIPLALAENAGMNPIDTLVELRARHNKGGKTVGVNAIAGKIEDVKNFGVYEPLAVKEQILSAATETTAMLLRIDDVIASKKSAGAPSPGGGGGYGGMPGGMG
jgi:chaperonin GroEL (HSP60 family)